MGISKLVCTNKKAYHDYEIVETFEAGLVLEGTEVKSLREGRANLKDSFARVEDGEVYLYNAHISEYKFGTHYNHKPDRKRKLLLKRAEINRLAGKVAQRGFTIIPLRIYFNERGWAKVEIALARGKRKYEKKEVIKQRDIEREVAREMKRYR